MGDDREAGHSKHKSKDKHRDRDRSDSKPRREDRNGRDAREGSRRDKDKVRVLLTFVGPKLFGVSSSGSAYACQALALGLRRRLLKALDLLAKCTRHPLWCTSPSGMAPMRGSQGAGPSQPGHARMQDTETRNHSSRPDGEGREREERCIPWMLPTLRLPRSHVR